MHRGREVSQAYANAPAAVISGDPGDVTRDDLTRDDLTNNPDIPPIAESFRPDAGRNDGNGGQLSLFLAISSVCPPHTADEAPRQRRAELMSGVMPRRADADGDIECNG